MVQTCSQVRSDTTRTSAVATLPGTCATTDGGAVGRLDGGALVACGAGEPDLASAADFELPRPVIRLTAASTQIATSATAIAAVQLARGGSARTAPRADAGGLTG